MSTATDHTPTETAQTSQPRGARPAVRRSPIGRLIALAIGASIVVLGGAQAVLGAASALGDLTVTERRFDPDVIDGLRVTGDAGDVTVVVGSGDAIVVTTTTRSSRWSRVTTDARTETGDLVVAAGCERSWFAGPCVASQHILIPAQAVGSVRVRTAAGDVRVEALTEDLDLETRAGDLTVTRYAGQVARLRTTAGDIHLEASSPPAGIDAATRAGDVSMLLPDTGYDLDVATTVGDIEVTVDDVPESDATITARTTAGDVSIRAR